MEVKQIGQSLYVKANEGKVLTVSGIQIGECVYVALDTDTSKFGEVTAQEETDVTLEEQNEALLKYVNEKTESEYSGLGEVIAELV